MVVSAAEASQVVHKTNLLDFAVLHGVPGVQPAGDGQHTAVLLPHMGLVSRLEQNNILHVQHRMLPRCEHAGLPQMIPHSAVKHCLNAQLQCRLVY